MCRDDWPQHVLLFQSPLNDAPSPQRKNMAPITAFTGCPASTPVSAFLLSLDYEPVSLTEAQLESALNVCEIIN